MKEGGSAACSGEERSPEKGGEDGSEAAVERGERSGGGVGARTWAMEEQAAGVPDGLGRAARRRSRRGQVVA